MDIKHDVFIPQDVKKDSKQFIKKHIDPKNCTIEAIHLGGSYTKNTSNKDSDVDLRIYYKIPLNDFLKTDIQTPEITNCDSITNAESKATTYNYNNRDYEIEFIPLKKNTSFKKELARCFIQPKADVVFKYIRAYPLKETPTMKRFRMWVMVGYYINPDSFFGYFDGYMTSQLQRHRRRKDGQRRATQARKLNSVTPVVKLTVDGLYMALSGIFLLEHESISRNVLQLHRQYDDLFNEEQNKFIDFCLDHKINRTLPDRGAWEWIDYAMDMRDELFMVLHTQIKISLAQTTIEWHEWMRKENKRNIESWLINEFYKV